MELRRIPIPDDSPEFLEVVCCWQQVAHFKDQRTIIEVFKLPENAQRVGPPTETSTNKNNV